MKKFWREQPFLIGVVHLLPLPGSPRFGGSSRACHEAALTDARAYREAGFDALLVENHGDVPFSAARVEPHVTAFLALISRDLREATGLPIGINCLRNDALSALGAAVAAGAEFVRVNVLTGVTATDQGLIEGCASSLARYRARLGVNTAILADLDVKFGTPLFRPSIPDAVASLVDRGGADGVIVTGSATGSPPTRAAVVEAAGALREGVPLLVGSGITAENIGELARGVAGFIVGTSVKEEGDVTRPVDPRRAQALVGALGHLRSSFG